MLVFVLYVLMKNVFYEAWGSRLFGSRKLWHKVSLLLDNLMWCVASLSSQVLFSRLPSFCFGLFGKSVFAVLCVCDRERMLHEVSHRIRYCCSDPPKFCRGSRTSLSLLEEISGSPNTCSKGHTLDNLVEFNALAMLCYHRSEDPCPCCCHQQFLSGTTEFYWFVTFYILRYSYAVKSIKRKRWIRQHLKIHNLPCVLLMSSAVC